MEPPPHVLARLEAMAAEEASEVWELVDKWRDGCFAATLGVPTAEEFEEETVPPPAKRAAPTNDAVLEDDEVENPKLLSWRLQLLPASVSELIRVEGKQLAPKLAKPSVDDILAWMARDRVVGLVGETATGKTAHVRAFAAAHGLTIVDVDVHESRDDARAWLELAVCRGLDPRSQGPRLWVLDGWDELVTDKGVESAWARELRTEWIPKMLRTGRVVLTSTDTSKDVRASEWPWIRLKKLSIGTSMQILRRCCAKFGVSIPDSELERLVFSTSDVGTAISMLETFRAVPAAADAESALPPHNPRDLVELAWRETSGPLNLMLEAEDPNVLLMLAQETAPGIACRAWGCGRAEKGAEKHGSACMPGALATAARLLDVCSALDAMSYAGTEAVVSGPLQAAMRAESMCVFAGGATVPMDVPVPRMLWNSSRKRDVQSLEDARKAREIDIAMFRDTVKLPAGTRLARGTTYEEIKAGVKRGRTEKKISEKLRKNEVQVICENFDARIDVLRDPRPDMIGVFKEGKGVW